MGKSGLKLVVTNLLLSGVTLRATAARRNKGHRNPIPDLPIANLFANRLNNTGQLMTRHMG